MEQVDTKAAVMSDIVRLLDVGPEEIADINAEFKELMQANAETTEKMIIACKAYDRPSFIIGAMVSAAVIDLVRDVLAQKMAEQDRLEGNTMYNY